MTLPAAAAEYVSAPPRAFATRLGMLATALERCAAGTGSVAVLAQRDDAAAGFDPPSAALGLLVAPLPEELSAFCKSPQSRWRIRFLLGLQERPQPSAWDELATDLDAPGQAHLCLLPFGEPGVFPSSAAHPLRLARWDGEVELSWSAARGVELRCAGAHPLADPAEARALVAWLGAAEADAALPFPASLPFPLAAASVAPFPERPGGSRPSPDFSSLFPGMERLREEMRAGNCYLANLCSREPWPGAAPFRSAADFVEAWLRDAPRFGAWIDLPDCAVASFTPERFLLRQGRALLTEPIKGTAACDPEAPEAGAEWLWRSAKEMAEHRMVVDLLRNDLNLACEPGSIGVWRPFHVQPRQGLHQMQSWVHGRARAGCTHTALLQQVLPAGSVSGTPKRAACALLRGLEAEARGYYTGVLLVSDAVGGFDSWILIRSYFRDAEGSWSVGVGAGITTLSEPAAEARECQQKWASIAWRALAAEGGRT